MSGPGTGESRRAVGIDAGSTTFKAVLVERPGPGRPFRVLARLVEDADPQLELQVARALDALRRQAGGGGTVLGPLVATGYGRKRVPGSPKLVTEITCHARGAFAARRGALALLELGGQDTKFIRISAEGAVEEFRMNDRCAAGTGRFLEVTLARLRVPLTGLVERVRRAPHATPISSTCAVFAETEVVAALALGEPVEAILAGLHEALAERLLPLIGVLPDHLPLWLAGGVAQNGALVDALAARLGRTPQVLPEPQLNGALGAALTLLGPD